QETPRVDGCHACPPARPSRRTVPAAWAPEAGRAARGAGQDGAPDHHGAHDGPRDGPQARDGGPQEHGPVGPPGAPLGVAHVRAGKAGDQGGTSGATLGAVPGSPRPAGARGPWGQ
ncbi:unnamed protein product, partial [Ixodes hexagonus]